MSTFDVSEMRVSVLTGTGSFLYVVFATNSSQKKILAACLAVVILKIYSQSLIYQLWDYPEMFKFTVAFAFLENDPLVTTSDCI